MADNKRTFPKGSLTQDFTVSWLPVFDRFSSFLFRANPHFQDLPPPLALHDDPLVPSAVNIPAPEKLRANPAEDLRNGLTTLSIYKGNMQTALAEFLRTKVQQAPEYQDAIHNHARTASGKPLKVDGIYGTYTQKALDGMLARHEIDPAMAEAITQLYGPRPTASAQQAKIHITIPSRESLTWSAPLSMPNTTAVFWGDSIAGRMALGAKQAHMFKNVISMTQDGSGFFNHIPAKDMGTLSPDILSRRPAAFFYYGTNDINSRHLTWKNEDTVSAYAKRVVDLAVQAQSVGMRPVVYGVNIPEKAYTENRAWTPEFLADFQKTARLLNAEYEKQCHAAGITFTNQQLTPGQISRDNLHPTVQGGTTLTRAGITALGAGV